MFVATFALVALSSLADATIILTTAAAATTVTLSASTVATLGLLGGVTLLKGLVAGLLVTRSKRSAQVDNQDAAFAVLASSEPAQCYRRLICNMATGAIPDQGKILSLFNTEVSPVASKFEYFTAAKVGKTAKNPDLCEVRYSCPLNNAEIAKLFA